MAVKKLFLLFGLCILLLASIGSAVLDDASTYWSFDNNTLIGSDPSDLSGNGDDGTSANVGIGIEGHLGQAFSFNGNNGLVDTTNVFNTNSGSWTIDTWINPNVLGIFSNVIISCDASVLNFHIDSTTANSGALRVYTGITNAWVFEGTHNVWTTGSFQHLILTYDTTTLRMYRNNVLIDSVITTFDGGSDTCRIGNRADSTSQGFDGRIDEFAIYPKNFTVALVNESWNGGVGINPYIIIINESLESTFEASQVGSLISSSSSFQNILDVDFNISMNNTPLWFEVTGELSSNVNNEVECQILVDDTDTFGSLTTRSNIAGVQGNIDLMTLNFTRDAGLVNVKYLCRKSSGGGLITYTNTDLIGHILRDEFNRSINHQLNNIVVSTSSSSLVEVGSYLFTMSNFSVVNDKGIVNNLVINWKASYTNNAGSDELLNSLISINGTNCSAFPRSVSSGATGSVGGICNLNNISANVILNISLLASGSNAIFNFTIHNSDFYTHSPQVTGSGDLVGLSVSSNTLTKIFNFSGGNTDHANTSIFVKGGFSINSSSLTNASFQFRLVNSANQSSSIISRDVNGDVGVSILQHVFTNVPIGNYSIELFVACGNSDCTIQGGQYVAYVTDVTSFLTNDFLVTMNNSYNGSSILNFNMTNSLGSVFFSNATGQAIITSNFLNDNLTFNADSFLSKTVLLHNTSQDLNVELEQSRTNVFANFKKDGRKILAFNITDGTIFRSTTDGNLTLPLNTGNYILVVDGTGYLPEFVSYEALSLSTSGIINRSLGNTTLNISAHNLLTGIAITSFSATIISSNGFYTENKSTTTGKLNFSNFFDNFTLIIDAEGFALHNFSINQENTSVFFNASLFTTNSLNITFFNAATKAEMPGKLITISFIGTTRQTNTTNTSRLYVDLLSPDEYTLVYSTPGFRQGQYIITITNRSTQELFLYLTNETVSSLILMTVNDKFGNILQGVDITIQRYSNDSWITDQIVRTDFQGRAEASFVLSTVFYNFLLTFEGITRLGAPNNDADKKVIYAEDVNDGLFFNLDLLGSSLLPSFQSTLTINVNISYINLTNTTGRFRFQYDDPDNNQRTGCLEVIKSNNEIICSCDSTTVISEGTTIFCTINQSSGTAYYVATGFVDGFPVVSTIRLLGVDTRINWGVLGYFLGFFLVLASFLIFLNNPTISIFFGTLVFNILGILGLYFVGVNGAVFLVLAVIGYIIGSIKSDSGVNA